MASLCIEYVSKDAIHMIVTVSLFGSIDMFLSSYVDFDAGGLRCHAVRAGRIFELPFSGRVSLQKDAIDGSSINWVEKTKCYRDIAKQNLFASYS